LLAGLSVGDLPGVSLRCTPGYVRDAPLGLENHSRLRPAFSPDAVLVAREFAESHGVAVMWFVRVHRRPILHMGEKGSDQNSTFPNPPKKITPVGDF